MTHSDDLATLGRFGTARGWAWHHCGLVVEDVDRAVEFYRTTLGFQVEFEVRGMDSPFQRMVGVDGIDCDLVQLRAPLSPVRLELITVRGVPDGLDSRLPVHVGVSHTAFQVEDLDGSVAYVCAAGGRAVGEIVEFAEGRAVYYYTSAGTVLELEEASPHRHEEGSS
ncbi:VOC family protein [uncultured Microbacterium sp.]|uniref:VOC family protein n=1 Tax=uncultured Microbacterium sp. TaxID=191216 RepID=UPI0035CBB082